MHIDKQTNSQEVRPSHEEKTDKATNKEITTKLVFFVPLYFMIQNIKTIAPGLQVANPQLVNRGSTMRRLILSG